MDFYQKLYNVVHGFLPKDVKVVWSYTKEQIPWVKRNIVFKPKVVKGRPKPKKRMWIEKHGMI